MTVAVISGDNTSREKWGSLLEINGFAVKLSGSAEDFWFEDDFPVPNCIVLNAGLPGNSGLDFQTWLLRANHNIPLVFIGADDDARACVRAMKAGAIDFLINPFPDDDLLDAVRTGVAKDLTRRAQYRTLGELAVRFASLSYREQEIMALLSAGQRPKQIAGCLGVSTHTARVHGSRVMSKMRAQSIVELVRMADRLRVFTDEPSVHLHHAIEGVRHSGWCQRLPLDIRETKAL